MEKQKRRVELLGTSFTIQSGDDPEYLDRLVSQLQVRISETKEAYPFADPVTIALLTALNLADELMRKRAGSLPVGYNEQIDEVTQRLLRRIDEELSEDSPAPPLI